MIAGFKATLPHATIYVYDNDSTDSTRLRVAEAGAIVRTETFQGKGNVVRRMFADIEAEVYVLVDGDGTYDPTSAAQMVEQLLTESLDMVNGARAPVSAQSFRPGHAFGNRLLTGTVALIFGDRLKDMLSGYSVLSRRFVKPFPALSSGFETKTELTVRSRNQSLLRPPLFDGPRHVTWFLNRRVTFRGTRTSRMSAEYLRDPLVQLVGAGINYCTFAGLLWSLEFFRERPIVAIATGSTVALAFNYLPMARFVFNRTPGHN